MQRDVQLKKILNMLFLIRKDKFMACETVIVNAIRTPFGRFGGGLASLKAVELGGIVIKSVLEPLNLPVNEIDEVIMGIVVTAGLGQIPSRQACAKAGLPFTTPSLTINKVCAGGLKAVTLADQIIRSGDADIIVAGGMESMSNAPYLLDKVRWGLRMGDGKLIDALVYDGLWCSFGNVHMAIHANNVAKELGVTREEQDRWALRSHQRAWQATQSGRLKKEILAVSVPGSKKGETVLLEVDEQIRSDTTLEKLAKLSPIFVQDGSVTAGNAPGVNDGAGALVIMSSKKAEELKIKPMARIVSCAQVGDEPPYLAKVPAFAIKKALKKANLDVFDLDLIEINEAFASVAITSTRLLEVDEEKVNVNGGAVAFGHPIGASGARLLTTLIYELKEKGKRYGAVGICSGAAQGDAIIIENIDN